MAMLDQLLRVPRNLKFSMIGLDQDSDPYYIRKCEKVTARPEILWHDAIYREADHYLKWLRSANVRIFYIGRPRVLSVTERLVKLHIYFLSRVCVAVFLEMGNMDLYFINRHGSINI